MHVKYANVRTHTGLQSLAYQLTSQSKVVKPTCRHLGFERREQPRSQEGGRERAMGTRLAERILGVTLPVLRPQTLQASREHIVHIVHGFIKIVMNFVTTR